jgi:tripartite-type tricarboxylate transporter receptor subunit TctC
VVVEQSRRHGQIRLLAVASERRLAAMPDIATAAEQGYPDLVVRLFAGLFAPAKTTRPIVAELEKVTQTAVQDPALQANFAAGGFEVVSNSNATSAAEYLNKEIVRWQPVIEEFSLNRK